MSALELHPWGSREDKLDVPDRMILDLDPGPGVSWNKVVAAAGEVRGVLDVLGLQSFVRTTGGKGLHVVVPLVRRASWDEVKEVSQAIADFFVRQDPSRYVATSSKARRNGKIYVDYLRNSRGATAIASYSTRARSGAPVATPLRWDELSPRLEPAKFNVLTVPDRLHSLKRDPWEGFFEVRQSATANLLQKLRE
jgi:bifunctional non-homologous end joining protein LigD